MARPQINSTGTAYVATPGNNKALYEGAVISTQVSPAVKIIQRSILDGGQAWRIFTETERHNRERNITDALIWNKYNGGQPFDPNALKNTGQGNRYNFPTGFLSSIVDRVTPVPVSIIDSARFLTSAQLNNIDPVTKQPDPDKGRRTEIIREKVTRAIRQWPDWKTFCTSLCQELVLIGRAFAIFLDPFTPWPKFFRTDQAFLPNGTGEHSRNVQILTAKQDLLVHELVNFVKDKESAKEAGWDIPNCVQAINEALPKQLNDDGSLTWQLRNYEDAIREGNLGMAYAGATIIPIAHVWAVEPNSKTAPEDNNVYGGHNKVTHYTLHRKGDRNVLFLKEDRYDRIENLVTMFTLEPGNGKFYGSKGLGRKLINKHLAIERARNRLFDQLEMSGLPILMTDAASAPMAQFKVRHPFILLTTDAKLQEDTIQANVKAYLDADAKMMDLAQQAVGQYLPNNLTNDMGERTKTAREVSVDYQREAEAKVAFLSRFWGQFADLVSAIQRKLLDPDTIDTTAKKLQAELKDEGITYDEMKEFSGAPAAEVVQDLTQIQNQQILAVAAKYGNDPRLNQRELLIRDIAAMASPTIAESLVLPEQGIETNLIEAARQQMIETEAILNGSPGLPVSPRDAHEIHLRVLIPDLQQGLMKQQQGSSPDALGKIAAGLTHAQGHIQQWQSTNGDPKQIKPYQQSLQQIDEALKQITIQTAKMLHDQATNTQQQQQNLPPPSPPLEKMLEIYKDAPDSIKRQIEARMGFTPPSPDEAMMETTKEALLKHPDLSDKIAQSALYGSSTPPSNVATSAPTGSQAIPPVPPSVTNPVTPPAPSPGVIGQ